MSYTVQYLGSHRLYLTWATYCYQEMAESVARREARSNPGVAYRVTSPQGAVTWAGTYWAGTYRAMPGMDPSVV